MQSERAGLAQIVSLIALRVKAKWKIHNFFVPYSWCLNVSTLYFGHRGSFEAAAVEITIGDVCISFRFLAPLRILPARKASAISEPAAHDEQLLSWFYCFEFFSIA